MREFTDQEMFWAETGGNDYVTRNAERALISSNTALFAEVFKHTGNICSVLELGANIGFNLLAINQLLPKAGITAVEINKKAFEQLKTLEFAEAHNTSVYDFEPGGKTWDLVFTKGVLIHQNPQMLPAAYDILYRASKRYILICEYYNPTPVEVKYRGNDSVLFKRDFAGEILDLHPSLRLIKYGFVYHRDNNFPCDDVNWFLMEKF